MLFASHAAADSCLVALLSVCAVEVILAAPGKVPKEEKLYVQKATFGKVNTPSTVCCPSAAAGPATSAAELQLVVHLSMLGHNAASIKRSPLSPGLLVVLHNPPSAPRALAATAPALLLLLNLLLRPPWLLSHRFQRI